MNFVGVDPSLRSTGVFALPYGAAYTRDCTSMTFPTSINAIASELCVKCNVHSGTIVLVEQPAIRGGGGAFERAAIAGAVLAAVAAYGGQAMWVNPMHVKQFVLGKLKRGEMGKDNVRLAVFERWGFKHASNDVVDAYVLARMAEAWHNPSLVPLSQRATLAKIKR